MIYVDALIPVIPTKTWPWGFACRMIADSPEELVKFGLKIGLKFRWLQEGKGDKIPYFDLNAFKRTIAIKNGAKELSRQEFMARLSPTPKEAVCECGHGFSLHRNGLMDGMICTVPDCRCLGWHMTTIKLPEDTCACIGSHLHSCRYYKFRSFRGHHGSK